MLNLLIRRELLNSCRNPQVIFQPILFFTLTICLFPIAMGAENDSLIRSAPVALWIALLLASLLAASSLFEEDYADGTLTQDIIHLSDLWLLILAKVFAVWIRFILPLLILLPMIALMLHIPFMQLPAIATQTALGSFALLMIGTLGALLTLNDGHNPFLQFLIVVPFYLPVLIIGTHATGNLLIGLNISSELALLGAFALFSGLSIVPLCTLALRTQPLP